MIGLTPKQAELLAYIGRHMAENPSAPSFEEMKLACGLKSKSGVHRLIHALVERGCLRRIPNRARALEVVDQNPLWHVSLEALIAEIERRGFTFQRAA